MQQPNFTRFVLILSSLAFACDEPTADVTEAPGSVTPSEAASSEEGEPAEPEGMPLVEVELAALGTILLPPERTVTKDSPATEENGNVVSMKYTFGEGTGELTIQVEGADGRIEVTDEASAQRIAALLARGDVQSVTSLDGNNFEVHTLRDGEKHNIFVANNNSYIKCTTTNADLVEDCRRIARSLPHG